MRKLDPPEVRQRKEGKPMSRMRLASLLIEIGHTDDDDDDDRFTLGTISPRISLHLHQLRILPALCIWTSRVLRIDNIHAEVVHLVHHGTGHCALQNQLEGLLPKISESLLIAQISEPDCYEICF
jgi:hypothetical protein